MLDPDVIIAAADHPSLDDGVADLVAELRAEPRFFGPSTRANPKPLPSVIDGLQRPGGLWLAAVGRDRVVGIVRIDPTGDVQLAVTRGRRHRGIGTALLKAAVERAAGEHRRLVLRASHRSEAATRAAAHVGGVAVAAGRGRVDIILPIRAGDRRPA